jgi:hypothetical protein
MFKHLLRAAPVLAVGLGVAAAAPAAGAMTIRAGDPEILSRVAVRVPLVVNCSPFTAGLTPTERRVSAMVQQAAGKQIARGFGINGFVSATGLFFQCDGTDQAVSVTVTADPAGPPFHGGPAVLQASAFAADMQSCGPNCYFGGESQSAFTDVVGVKL